jgi:hypothetical protein
MKSIVKSLFALSLALALFVGMAACSSTANDGKAKLLPINMLDNDTGKIYSLGEEKAKFDSAFGYMGIEEDGDDAEYLSGVLTVTYSDDKAIQIEVDGSTDRFSFYNFNFAMDIKQIEGRYEKSDIATGYIFYNRYYDNKGSDVPFIDATIEHTLMVRDGDLLNMKDGEYLHYFISLVNAY